MNEVKKGMCELFIFSVFALEYSCSYCDAQIKRVVNELADN